MASDTAAHRFLKVNTYARNMDSTTATIDSLLEDLGGCGLYQVLFVTTVYGATITVTWSMIFMAFGAYDPGWTCDSGLKLDENLTESLTYNNSIPFGNVESNDHIRSSSCMNYSLCDNVVYSEDSSTIVTEWNLACDNFYMTSAMTSLQMGGVLIGTFLAGHLSNLLGRKPTHFLTLGVHAFLNLVAMFSVNWQMFAALRFFIGISCGFLIITAVIYPMEFTTRKCRSVVTSIPFWNGGAVLFSVTAMLLRDWRYVHLVTSILTAVFILPVFLVPESVRWLTVKGKTEKAYRVAKIIGKVNGKKSPNMNAIDVIAEEDQRREKEKPNITVIDLYRPRFLKRTLITSFMWLSFTLVYYAIFYGVKSLSGNFYVNLMIISCVTTVSYPFVPIVSNNLGRKLGCICFMSVAALGCICLVILHFLSLNVDKGLATLILTLLVLTFIDASWAVAVAYLVELYPTMLRSLALSHASSVARIGGMIAPFLISRDESTLYISHLVMTIFIVVTVILILFLPETRKKEMQDSMGYSSKRQPIFNDDACPASEHIEI